MISQSVQFFFSLKNLEVFNSNFKNGTSKKKLTKISQIKFKDLNLEWL